MAYDVTVQEAQNAPTRYTRVETDGQLLALWVRGLAQSSREYYIADAIRFLQFAGKGVREVTPEDLYDFQDTLDDAESTNYRRMSVVKSLLSFANDIGYAPFNVGLAVRLHQPDETINERIVAKDTIHKLIDAAKNERDRLLLATMYYTGMRVSEVVSLEWRNLELGVLSVRGKGGKTRHIKLKDSLNDALLAFQGDADRNTRIFPMTRENAWHIVKRAKRNAGVEKEVSPHWFRHAHASHALDNDAPIHLVQKTLGHSNLQTTSRYVHVRPDESSGDYL